MNSYILDPVHFQFHDDQISTDKLRGLRQYGPYLPLDVQEPCCGFVFPSGCSGYANRLYVALKNGVGYFRGVENTFRYTLRKDRVFPIPVTGYSPSSKDKPSVIAAHYKDAILSWYESHRGDKPDLVYVIHPRTATYDLSTAYYECKAQLLKQGFLSQNVTLDLLDNESQFNWSAANIALASFVKLGGTPWVLGGVDLDQDLIIGLGRAYLYDPTTRSNSGYIAFTACFTAMGSLKFVNLGELANSRTTYLSTLAKVIEASIDEATGHGQIIRSITVHAPKEMAKEEMATIRDVLNSESREYQVHPLAVKITDESQYFVVDKDSSYGIPARGTVVKTTDRDILLYTEGRDEVSPWSRRLPVSLRVTSEYDLLTEQQARSVLQQVNDLSQINWRGFNARSRPISIHYASLIAKLLSHIPRSVVADLQQRSSSDLLRERMWFL